MANFRRPEQLSQKLEAKNILFVLTYQAIFTNLHILIFKYTEFTMKKDQFDPLQMLSAVGAGGISVIPFSFLQYTFYTGKGLITFNTIDFSTLKSYQSILFPLLLTIMAVFGTLHFVLSAQLYPKLLRWMKTPDYKSVEQNPLKNSALLTPFIALAMSFNVFIAVVCFFVPFFSDNFQLLMAPALALWSILWFFMLKREFEILKIAFSHSFNSDKINFSWLLHSFALSMVSVAGSGLAAMALNPTVAHIAAFMTVISGGLGIFILTIVLFLSFKNQMASSSLPSADESPAMLSLVPLLTLYSITGFRLVHYFEKQFDSHIHWLAVFIVVSGFAFQTWYLAFSATVMKDFFKDSFFKGEFRMSLWSLICPFVAYAVLGSFIYKFFIPNTALYTLILLFSVAAISMFATVLFRQIRHTKSKTLNYRSRMAA